MAEQEDTTELEEPPPFLGTWRRVYTAVLSLLAALIILLYTATELLKA